MTSRSALTRPTRTGAAVAVTASVALAVMLVTSCVPASTPWTSDVPAGNFDSASMDRDGRYLTVSGWAADRNTSDPLRVMVFIDDELQFGSITAGRSRPDVQASTGRGGNSGFHTTLDIKLGRSPSMKVCLAAMNVGPGANAWIGCKTVSPSYGSITTTPKTTTTTIPKTSTTTTTLPVPPVHCDSPAETEVDWHDCDKHGVDLSYADLFYANLSGIDLSDANLLEATLSYADLTDADLSGADLTYAGLIGSDLSGADMAGANLTGANLSYADTAGADITSVTWASTTCPDLTSSAANDPETCLGHGF